MAKLRCESIILGKVGKVQISTSLIMGKVHTQGKVGKVGDIFGLILLLFIIGKVGKVEKYSFS